MTKLATIIRHLWAQRIMLALPATILLAALAAVPRPDLSAAMLWLLLPVLLAQLVIAKLGALVNLAVPTQRLSRRTARNSQALALVACGVLALALPALLLSVPAALACAGLALALGLIGNRGNMLLLADRFVRRLSATTHFRQLRPQIVLYHSGPPDTAYQINQWLGVLEALPFRCAILLRNKPVFDDTLDTRLDTYFARGARQLETLLTSGPQTLLYPNNREKNHNSLRHFKLAHIFINHGESDKVVNQSKMMMAYDHLFVGGPLAEFRLRQAGLPLRPGQCVQVGRPPAELTLVRAAAAPAKITRVLYAPTWEGGIAATAHSSVSEFGLELLEKLFDRGIEVKFKPHPLTGTVLAARKLTLHAMQELCRKRGGQVLGVKDSLHDAMNWSDVLVCDVSAVLNDYLVTGKPVILCNVLHRDTGDDLLHAVAPSARAAYVIEAGGDIDAAIARIEAGDDLAATRAAVRRQSLGDGSAMDRFIAAIGMTLHPDGEPGEASDEHRDEGRDEDLDEDLDDQRAPAPSFTG